MLGVLPELHIIVFFCSSGFGSGLSLVGTLKYFAMILGWLEDHGLRFGGFRYGGFITFSAFWGRLWGRFSLGVWAHQAFGYVSAHVLMTCWGHAGRLRAAGKVDFRRPGASQDSCKRERGSLARADSQTRSQIRQEGFSVGLVTDANFF